MLHCLLQFIRPLHSLHPVLHLRKISDYFEKISRILTFGSKLRLLRLELVVPPYSLSIFDWKYAVILCDNNYIVFFQTDSSDCSYPESKKYFRNNCLIPHGGKHTVLEWKDFNLQNKKFPWATRFLLSPANFAHFSTCDCFPKEIDFDC